MNAKYTKEQILNILSLLTYTEQLKWLILTFPDNYGRMLKSKNKRFIDLKYLYDWINEQTPLLNNAKYSIATKCYWIIHNITKFPKCTTCNNNITRNVINVKIGYSKNNVLYCSHLCSMTNKNTKNKREETNIKLFGNKCNMATDEFKQQSKCTKLKKYGDENYNNSKQMKITRIKNNNGVYFSSEQLEKSQQTCLKHFGVRFPAQNYKSFIKRSRKYKYNGILFDSSPEIALYIYLTDKAIDFEYQPNTNFIFHYNGKIKKYFPDFLVNGQFIEIKGDQFFKEDGTMQCPFNHKLDNLFEAKHQCMISNNVQIL